MNKKLEILGFLSIILISGITVQDAFADIVFTGIVDLLCEGDTELAYVDTIDFLVMCPLFGASPPVISLTGFNNVELILGFTHIDDGATAIDTGDGDLTGNIVTSGLPVDTSTIGTFFVTFDVTDSAGNDALQVVRSVTTVKRDPTSTSIDSLPDVGGQQQISKIPPPLFTPEAPAPTIDEAFDLFATLNQFFTPREREPVIQPVPELAVEVGEQIMEQVQERIAQPIQERIPEPATITTSLFESIRSFFSSLFG